MKFARLRVVTLIPEILDVTIYTRGGETSHAAKNGVGKQSVFDEYSWPQ